MWTMVLNQFKEGWPKELRVEQRQQNGPCDQEWQKQFHRLCAIWFLHIRPLRHVDKSGYRRLSTGTG
ncbi:MAG: hypothetical protein E8D45_05825 [Nitrospira sp.]|nr:MAG: hypothetical protein E8D45_05825 [Nitrospira sp.]